MTLCEFHFESVLLLGADDCLDAVTARLDELFRAQWVLDDAARSRSRDGRREICLFRLGGRADLEYPRA